jgi:hypothetical protein
MSEYRVYVSEDFDYDTVCDWSLGYRWFDNSTSRCEYPQMSGTEIINLCNQMLQRFPELNSVFIWCGPMWVGNVSRF